jgi:hypothetical protein
MHMTHRMGNAGTAILIGALATFVVAMSGAAHAAADCLAGPKGAAPKGSHWYYRIDRATKRNCWYVRAAGEKPASSQNASVTTVSPPPPAPLQPAVANARAEAAAMEIGQPTASGAMPESIDAANNAEASDVSAADNGQSTVASRWLDQAAADTADRSTADPAQSGASTNPSTAPPPAAVNRAASSGSVSTLFLVILGALAVAGLFAGVIFRFGNARRNQKQELDHHQPAPWDVIDVGATIQSPPLAAHAAATQSSPARERHEAVIPDEIVRLLSTLSKEAPA